MLDFYFAPGACSLASHIVLEESGVPYRALAVNLAAREQMSAGYKRVNPRGKVPALVDGGRLVTENLAIMHYVARMASEANLLPPGPLDTSLCLSFISWVGSHVHTAFRQYHRPERFVDAEEARISLKAKSHAAFADGLAEIDATLAGRDWVIGDRYSIADPYAYVFWTWGREAGFDLRSLSAYAAHAARVEARPAAAIVLRREKDAADAFNS